LWPSSLLQFKLADNDILDVVDYLLFFKGKMRMRLWRQRRNV